MLESSPPEQDSPDPPPATARRALIGKIAWILWPLALAVAIGVGGSFAIQLAAENADSDGDGLRDVVEANWISTTGDRYTTDPRNADTDGDGLTDGEEASELNDGQYTAPTDPTKADTDNDTLDDLTETRGWSDADGTTFRANPRSVDTDADGLTDGEEAGELNDGQYTAPTDPTKADTDNDTLDDLTETRGWTDATGATFLTNPRSADTDDDGLTDREEAGQWNATSATFSGYSDPLAADSDGDGLTDVEEADLSLLPRRADTDADGLDDGYEVSELGTAPDLKDTDEDGYDDKFEADNRSDGGFDPLWPDIPVDPVDYAKAFATGAFAGEFIPADADASAGEGVAWLLGNISGTSAAFFIPLIGPALTSAADLRDSVGLAIRGEWISSGIALVGVIPVLGDAVGIPRKVATFVQRYPQFLEPVGVAIARLTSMPDAVKANALRAVYPESWDQLKRAGMSDRTIIRLTKGNTSPDDLVRTMARSADATHASAPWFTEWRAAESFLESSTSRAVTQRNFSTQGCRDVCNELVRRVDVFADGVAHESKSGRVSLTPSIRSQIESDAYLISTGVIKSARWHFYPSGLSNSVGATSQVLDLLEARGIPFSIYLPQ